MLKYNKFFLIAAFCLLAVAVPAQKALDKPIDKWSKSDAMEILNNSSWTQTYFSTAASAGASANNALRDQADNSLTGGERSRTERSGGPPPVIARLHSALPIRLALIRLNQIGSGYDKMNDKAKAEFNDSARGLLECNPCKTHYVITVTLAPNPTGQSVEEAVFQGMTLAQMKGNVTLRNDKGESRELAHFIAPEKRGDSAVFFFARKDDKGSTLIEKGDKEVNMVFDASFFNGNRFAPYLPRKFDFSVSKITVADQVVF